MIEISRRQVLRALAGLAGAAVVARFLPGLGPRIARAAGEPQVQLVNVAFWIANGGLDAAAVDFAIPLGPSRSSNVDLCAGAGSCPSGCPKPVQDFVFIFKDGGATVIRDIVMSVEAPPGSKARQFTAASDCTAPDPDNPGTAIRWYKYVATSVD